MSENVAWGRAKVRRPAAVSHKHTAQIHLCTPYTPPPGNQRRRSGVFAERVERPKVHHRWRRATGQSRGTSNPARRSSPVSSERRQVPRDHDPAGGGHSGGVGETAPPRGLGCGGGLRRSEGAVSRSSRCTEVLRSGRAATGAPSLPGSVGHKSWTNTTVNSLVVFIRPL